MLKSGEGSELTLGDTITYAAVPTPDTALERERGYLELWRQIDALKGKRRLKPVERSVLSMFCDDPTYTITQVAAQLGKKENYVKGKLDLALRKIRAAISSGEIHCDPPDMQ